MKAEESRRGRPRALPEQLVPPPPKPMKSESSHRRGPMAIPPADRAPVTDLPTSPCFLCGSRGPCQHWRA